MSNDKECIKLTMVISQDGIAHEAIKIRFLRIFQWCGEITTIC